MIEKIMAEIIVFTQNRNDYSREERIKIKENLKQKLKDYRSSISDELLRKIDSINDD